MSAWTELRDLGVTLRPIDRWPQQETRYRSYSPFRSSLSQTLKVLAKELNQLRAKRIVLEVDFRERDLRLDGLPRSDARMLSPRVGLSFDSKWGPLVYRTDAFLSWEDNLRAIALSMESLRKVDRYGVSKRGEQYRGWTAIAASSHEPADDIVDSESAQQFLDEHGGSFIAAVKKLHPDTGTDKNPLLFHAAMKARDVLAGKA